VDEILTILEPRVHAEELHGYYDGKFNPDKTKFVGYTYVPLDSIDLNDYRYMLTSSSYSSTGVDLEKRKKYLDAHSYQMKSAEECIEQGIYKAYSMRFQGVYFKDEWFILPELVFFGEQMTEEEAKAFLSMRESHPDHWNASPFDVGSSFTLPGTNEPVREIEREEFKGMPWLVSQIKIDNKNKVNRAFSHYMNVTVVHPFLCRMRVRSFDEFPEFMSLFGEDYTLVFPESKTFFLIVTMAGHRIKGYRLVWFFYDIAQGRFYRWTYPQPRFTEWSYHYPEDVIMDLQAISDWDDCRFLNSSRTMDDQRFWSEYVLKKEEGRYRWLEEIAV